MPLSTYETEGFFDEMFVDRGVPRPECRSIVAALAKLQDHEIRTLQRAAEQALLNAGITFNVYGDEQGVERVFPFDLVPRIVTADEWVALEAGLRQRVLALNMFLQDVYGEARILAEGIVPRELVLGSSGYRPNCVGLKPPGGVWIHIDGADLVRDRDGKYYVLEDNGRNPSGVSYVIENREIMKRTFPDIFEGLGVRPVSDYPAQLLQALESLTPESVTTPTVVLLTPGRYNSAYFEHSFLAQAMGIQLVEGRDLVVQDGIVSMRTTQGLQRVDVVYRRVDDDFLDPMAFREDSMLGVPGIMDVYRSGRIAIANAPGTGVADDKVIYAFVPDMIRFYLSEEPKLPNVPTYLCWRDEDLQYVLTNLEDLVVKPAAESGGYGMLVGPTSTAEEREAFRDRIQANPRNYIAQPTLALSRMPTFVDGDFAGRHIDLRPYIVSGSDGTYVTPGGLTRVALRQGSLVVNSSQGGGSKDTWVLGDGEAI